MRLAKRFRADETGSTLLETALCGSLVLLVILGIMESSLAVYSEHYVESAAESGARYASLRGSTYAGTSCASYSSYFCQATNNDVTSYIQANAAGIAASKISVTTSWPGISGGAGTCNSVQGNNGPGCLVTVAVTYPFTLILPAPLNKTITFSASRSTVISQ